MTSIQKKKKFQNPVIILIWAWFSPLWAFSYVPQVGPKKKVNKLSNLSNTILLSFMGFYCLPPTGLFLSRRFYSFATASIFCLVGAFLRIFILLSLIFPYLQSLPVDLVGTGNLRIRLYGYGGAYRYSLTYHQLSGYL